MKNRAVYFLILILINSVSHAQSNFNFIISGEISGIKDGSTISLYSTGYKYFVSDTTSLANATVTRGRFKLTGCVKRSGARYMLKKDYEAIPFLYVYLDSGSTISLKGRIDRATEIVIKDQGGLGTQNDRDQYLKLMSPIIKQINSPNDYKKNVGDKIFLTKKEFIKNHKNSYYSPSIMLKSSDDLAFYFRYVSGGELNFTMPQEEVKQLFSVLNDKAKNSSDGLTIKGLLDQLETLNLARSASSEIGEKFPLFNWVTPEGSFTSLTQLLEKSNSKLILLFLWNHSAARNGNINTPISVQVSDGLPVEQIKQLNAFSMKYDQSQLSIVGIDRCASYIYDRNKQVERIEEYLGEKIQWKQFVDLRTTLGADYFSYAQTFFKSGNKTYMALLDKEGKIIAKDLTIGQAEQKIKEILGE